MTVSSLQCSYPGGLVAGSLLLKVTETVALVTPAWPCLYTSSWSEPARTWEGGERGGGVVERRVRGEVAAPLLPNERGPALHPPSRPLAAPPTPPAPSAPATGW